MKFALMSDQHLGYRQYGLRERERDFMKAFTWALNYCYEVEVEYLLFGGDLFHHKNPPVWVLNEVCEILGQVTQWSFVIAITGNHEFQRDGTMSIIDYLANIWMLRKPPFDTGLKVEGLDWAAERTTGWLSTTDPCDVMLVHAAHESTVRFKVPEIVSDELLQSLPAKVVGMGHIHKSFQKGKVYNPGSLETTSISELDDSQRGFYVFDDFQPIKVVTPKRPFYQFDVDSSDCLTNRSFCSKIEETISEENLDITGSVVVLTLSGPVNLTNTEVMDSIHTMGTPLHVITKVIPGEFNFTPDVAKPLEILGKPKKSLWEDYLREAETTVSNQLSEAQKTNN